VLKSLRIMIGNAIVAILYSDNQSKNMITLIKY